MVRWGIVGAGNIAHTFAKDLALVKGNRLAAVASRSLEKAIEFTNTYGAEHSFGDYDALFKSDTVDVVYIATPHTSHTDLSIRAMDNKKHVLCEKPMGINSGEVRKMLQKAKENNVFLMEALWTRFNPTIRKVKQLIDQGTIGKIAYVKADFAFYGLDRAEQGRLLNPDLAGGSVLDIGIYPIFLSYLILGMPNKITATSKFHSTGVEVQTAMIFEYENAHSLLFSGLTSNSEMKAEISGSMGTLFINSRWHEASSYVLDKDGASEQIEIGKKGKGYTYEIEEVSKCINEGKLESALWSHQNTIDLCSLLDTVREQAGIRFPFET